MTVTYAQKYALGSDTALRQRLVADLVEKANYFLAAAGQTAPTVALASAIVRGGVQPYVEVFARQVAANGTAQGQAAFAGTAQAPTVDTSGITDTTIDSVVSAEWAAIAGG